MIIRGSDITEDERKMLLLREDEILSLEEIERGPGTGLRRFQLRTHEGGLNAGEVYEDQLVGGVLEKYDEMP